MEWFMYLERILAIILMTSSVLLVSGTIYAGAVILTHTTAAFERLVPLPKQHTLELSKRPACTWDRPSIIACYQGGLHPHPEMRLIYYDTNSRHVLVSFELPGR
jgi:hypothetical protein